MALDIVTYAAAKSYVKSSLNGLGALKGKNCEIDSINTVGDENIITFKWTGDDGTIKTSSLTVKNGEAGLSIQSVDIDSKSHLIVTYSDGTTKDAGEIKAKVSGDLYYTKSEVNALISTGGSGSVTADDSDIDNLFTPSDIFVTPEDGTQEGYASNDDIEGLF